jgi:primosomal protein N' (replication factor Y)
MEEVLDQGGSVLYLVPEISLVPQTVNRVMRLAGDEAVIWHSRQNRSEKGEEFRKILQQKCRIVVGTRSAVFLPIPNLRLIIIDEEHDTSYVQTGDGAHDARDVARFLSKTTGAHLLYGSATPSMQQYHRAKLGEIKLLELTQRVGGLTMPQIMRVDLLGDGVGNDTISKQLRQEIDLELESGGQILLFLNRKGYAPVVLCRSCGEICRCRDCDVTLTYHQSSRSLLCHFCGYKIDTPKKCAKCSATSIKYVGMGTERIAEEARRFFPGARVVRFDAETIRNSEDLEKALEQVSSGGIDIIVGTQIFSKGHDFQGLTLVGMISADTSMSMPDFRASERTFQMIRQVTGRVGRDENPGRAIIQSYAGDHYAIKTAVEGDFSKFYEKEITYRKRYKYPPFTRMVRYLVTGLEEEKVEAGTEELYKELQQQVETDWVIHPPVMAPVYRIKQRFRRHILLFLPTGEDIPETLVKLREQVIKAKWLRGLSLLVMLDPEDVL